MFSCHCTNEFFVLLCNLSSLASHLLLFLAIVIQRVVFNPALFSQSSSLFSVKTSKANCCLQPLLEVCFPRRAAVTYCTCKVRAEEG